MQSCLFGGNLTSLTFYPPVGFDFNFETQGSHHVSKTRASAAPLKGLRKRNKEI